MIASNDGEVHVRQQAMAMGKGLILGDIGGC
jgi:hypothetical protein